jgi:hypothetical protein
MEPFDRIEVEPPGDATSNTVFMPILVVARWELSCSYMVSRRSSAMNRPYFSAGSSFVV